MADENELLASVSTDLPPARQALAFAPHPDDEVFGCGGTLALLRRQGSSVSVIVATDGAAGGEDRTGELVQQREAESRAAAAALEIPEPFFWRLPDRGLAYGEPLIERIATAITGAAADLVLLPSPTELHPDHQALALAGAEAVRRLGGELRALFYEINQPLPNPNLLLDITPVFGLKQAAMACFPSQLAEQPYDRRIEGLNHFRSYFLGAQAEAAEACVLLEAAGLRPGLSPLFDGPLAHRRKLGFAASGDDIPLVSVIVRSMDRSTLERALSSIALQTWTNLEVVVVNAKGGDHTPPGEYCGPFPLRLINQGGEPLRRSAAANRGLAASRGRYLCFLDDDDSMDPGHIAGLVNALCGSPPHEVAYAGIRGQQGTPPHEQLTEFCEAEVDFTRLLLGNAIPIHAVLFSARFVQEGICFDEHLDSYEDWDFWLQLARQAPFVFVNQISATYYTGGDSAVGLAAAADMAAGRQAAHNLLAKWLQVLTPAELDAVAQRYHHTRNRLETELAVARHCVAERDVWLAVHDARIAALDTLVAALNAQIADLDVQIADRDTRIVGLTAQLADRDARIAGLDVRIADCDAQLADRDTQLADRDARIAGLNVRIADLDAWIAQLYASRSWRIAAPLRWIARKGRSMRNALALRGAAQRLLRMRPWPEGPPYIAQGFAGEPLHAPPVDGRQPLISVIMPVYNACRSDRRYFIKALESIARQTYRHIELIVVDDGSTDDTRQVFEEFFSQHPGLQACYYHKENGGQSSARNYGAQRCRGEYIGFLDQDDEWLADKLEKVVPWLADPEIDLLYTDADVIDGDDRITYHRIHQTYCMGWPHPKRCLEDILYKDIIVMPGLMTIRKELFERVGGFDEQLSGYEDDDLFLRLYQNGRVFYLPEVTLRWRIYGDNYSFSHRMLASRSRYWQKLMAGYTSEGRDRFRTRMISQRFFWEFINRALDQHEAGNPLYRQSMNGAQEILPHLEGPQRLIFRVAFLFPTGWVAAAVRLSRKLARVF